MRRDLVTMGSIGLGAETVWPCVALMTLGGAVLSVPVIRMLRRGAPFAPRSAAFLGGLGALSVASIEACLARPHDYGHCGDLAWGHAGAPGRRTSMDWPRAPSITGLVLILAFVAGVQK
jgi:hypothetical protein